MKGKLIFEWNEPISYSTYLFPGKYLFELWGAQGGCLSDCTEATGGYSKKIESSGALLREYICLRSLN